MTRVSLPLVFLLLLSVSASMHAQRTPGTPVTAAQLESEVRAEFQHAWSAYKEHAWGHDELRPVTRSYTDLYGQPFFLTAVDALDALMVMGFDKEADSTRTFLTQHLSFDKDVYVGTFDFTSHYLGGLLAAFQMSGDEKLLALARDLADRLLPAFLSPTSMPYAYVNLKTGAVRGERNTPEGVGSLLLEFGTLSVLTGETKYYNTAKIAMLALYEQRPALGFAGDSIDVATGEWTCPAGHVGRGVAGYYEYLAVCAHFFLDDDCSTMLKTSLEAVNTYLRDSTAAGQWYGQANIADGRRTGARFGAADALFPGVLALSDDVPGGSALQNSSFKAFLRFGAEPEQFNYRSMELIAPECRLDPGMAKSVFHLYWLSGDPVYLSMGRDLLDSTRAYCRMDEGYAELASVVTKEKADRMPSIFLSGTLRYLYLLFMPRETLSYDRFAFTSAGHMLRKTW